MLTTSTPGKFMSSYFFLIQSNESRDSLNSSCLALDRYQHEIEAKCVSQSKKDNKRVLSIYESKSLWVHESMSQRVSAVTQTHKMKAKISECLGLITERRG